jgi:type I restriction enzyme R subunit
LLEVIDVALGNEHEAVQRALVRYAVEAGWTELAPDEALRYRANGILSPLLDSVFIEQVQRLNPGVVDYRRAEDIAKRLVRVRPSIEGNLDAWQYLKGLKTVFVEEQKRERNVRLLDLVNIDANKFHVTPLTIRAEQGVIVYTPHLDHFLMRRMCAPQALYAAMQLLP